jgi:hypothetical protein
MGVALGTIFLCDNRICNGVLLVMLINGLAALQKVYSVTCPDTTGPIKGYVLKVLGIS